MSRQHTVDSRKGYKLTEIGEIPEDWEMSELGKYIDVYSGFAFKTRDFLSDKSIGIPIIKIGNLQGGSVVIDEKTSYVLPNFYDKLPKFQLHYSDVLIALSGATTGKVAVINKNIGKALANQRIGKFKVLHSEKIDRKFFYYFSQSTIFNKSMLRNIGRSAQGNLSPEQIKKLPITLPPLPEQRMIAKILSTADETIQQTSEIIAKTQELKKGLMQELLTKGIGHTRFKKTEVDEIPEEWEVVKLGDITHEIYYGITARATDKESPLKMLRTTDIKNYSTDWEKLPYCEITEKRNNIGKYFLEKDDLIIARAGTTGVSILVDRSLNNMVFGSYLIKAKLKAFVHSKFIHYFLQSNFYWNHILSTQAGSTMKNINLPILKSLRLPLPPLPEQKKIAEILSCVDEKIELERKKKAELEELKKGLMQDLLTGRVRVISR